MSEDRQVKAVREENMEELAELMDWWRATNKEAHNKSQNQLEKVYANYKKLETVHRYDAMMSSFQENEEAIQNFARDRTGEHLDAAHHILSYICQWIAALGGEFTLEALPKDSKDIKELSGLILGFRPICSLVDIFGKGVLLLLVDKAEKWIPGKVEEG